jgi:hypothetical protein
MLPGMFGSNTTKSGNHGHCNLHGDKGQLNRGRCVAAPAPPPRCAMPRNAPDQLRSGHGEAAEAL